MDYTGSFDMKNITLSSEYDIILRGAIHGGCEYLNENPAIKTMVIGISGGIDSALTAALAQKVCLAHEKRGIKLLGYCLEIDGNKPDELERAIAVGKTLCHEFSFINLTNIFLQTMKEIDKQLYEKYTSNPIEFKEMVISDCTLDEKVRAGNIKARVRMLYLYNQARLRNGIVLSTDNYTELQLGFWTLHGDVGDFGFIQELWKTEVYGLAAMIGGPLKSCIEATPTDGLGITNSDIDQLLPDWKPKGNETYVDAYKIVDEILIDHLSGFRTYPKDHPVIARNISSEFKRRNPVSIKRELLLWRHNIAWLPKK
jgi:NAD+ synthetase